MVYIQLNDVYTQVYVTEDDPDFFAKVRVVIFVDFLTMDAAGGCRGQVSVSNITGIAAQSIIILYKPSLVLIPSLTIVCSGEPML